MKIYLDNIIFSLQKSGGISVYWYEIINRILNQKEVDFTFIEESNTYENIFRKKLEIKEVNICNYSRVIFKFLSRYREINLKLEDTVSIFHSSYYRTYSKKIKKEKNIKEVVTVHDFTYEHYNNAIKKWVHSAQKKKAIREADVVICISENTKKDLLHFYPEFLYKDIRVIYNGVSSDYFVIPELKNIKTTTPYFLFVGSRASYKNFNFTVNAISQTEKFLLKIVGSSLNEKELKMLNKLIPGRWELFVNIENEVLNKLYNSAYALIYPSSYEGFGIPLLEAMKAGCPFIALNASSIPEVSGGAGVLIDRLEISLFNEAIDIIDSKREEIIKKGLNQANNFSWDKCYNEILNIYKELNTLNN